MKQNNFSDDTYCSGDDDFGPLFATQSGMSNSISSYHAPATKMKAAGQVKQVYEAIRAMGQACDRDISQYTGIEINLIPDRRKKLLDMGLIYIHSNRRNPQTNALVNYYKIKETQHAKANN